MDEPIAVIGLGCRFPGDIAGPDSLWQFLSDGRSAVAEVPPDRWVPFDDGSPEAAAALAHTTRWGSFLDDIDGFDAEFFDISAAGGGEHGPAAAAAARSRVGGLGARRDSARVLCAARRPECSPAHASASTDIWRRPTSAAVDAWTNTGGALSIIANRLSYFLDLRGPSLAVDTACSSSLVAVHLACQSLRTGDSELAIAAGREPAAVAGGVRAASTRRGALSPTGRCHAFDAAADGFVRGEGCGVAVLKRLSDALRDGDRVLAVVRGSAVNQDGRSNGLMAPNPAAQTAVLRGGLRRRGRGAARGRLRRGARHRNVARRSHRGARPRHRVLGRGRPEDAPLLIGAVKSNLGHLEAAAGIAGFIKTVLAVQRGTHPGEPALRDPESAHPVRPAAAEGRCRTTRSGRR